MQIATIAERRGVPRKFLEQILVDLKKRGIVRSQARPRRRLFHRPRAQGHQLAEVNPHHRRAAGAGALRLGHRLSQMRGLRGRGDLRDPQGPAGGARRDRRTCWNPATWPRPRRPPARPAGRSASASTTPNIAVIRRDVRSDSVRTADPVEALRFRCRRHWVPRIRGGDENFIFMVREFFGARPSERPSTRRLSPPPPAVVILHNLY